MSSLVVPGSSAKMLEKARGIEVDEIVIDLEDAVVPGLKREALRMAVEALYAGGFAARKVSVRVNAPGTPWANHELMTLATAAVRPSSVVLPKVNAAGDIAYAERLLDGAEWTEGDDPNQSPIAIQALIETAAGLSALDTIASESQRLDALIIGYADLAVSLGRPSPGSHSDPSLWLPIQNSLVIAARTNGLTAIDGPFLGVNDTDAVTQSAKQAAAVGFDGKWAIHPAHIEPIREAFAPGTADVAHARAVLHAMAHAAEDLTGAVQLDGEMLDEPVRLAAIRTLRRAGEDVG